LTQPFYVMGQVASGNPITTITPPKGQETCCYNMIAPPSTVAQYLNGSGEHSATWDWNGTDVSNDSIIIPTQYLPVELKYKNSAWRCSQNVTETNYYTYAQGSGGVWTRTKSEKGVAGARAVVETTTQWVEYETPIPVGTGFWYVSYGGAPSVTWHDVPEVPQK